MKKTLAVLLLLLALCSLSACAAVNGAERPESGEMPAAGEMPEGMPDMGEMPEGMPDMDEMPSAGGGTSAGSGPSAGSGTSALQVEVAETVSGEVTSIVGNEVTLETDAGEEVYLLPVGMPIGSGDFTSVSAGMRLTLSLSAEGGVVAASVA